MAEGRYKLLVGKVRQSGWCGQFHPNRTQPWDTFDRNSTEHCTVHHRHPKVGLKKVGCLFDVLADPTEHHDLALEMPEKAAEIFEKMKQAETHWFNPDRGGTNQHPDHDAGVAACRVARETGFYQPYLP